ncbi:TPA: substrate-binding domain-containing protein [Haemophilus influenzae]|uniref:substrate-binding domain-containing protein n=2 Tax=Haemophilus influenzae TaxID=727 RepID=UPI0005AF1FD3|nr:substrate-binding domain-containing protein [Haemophilus influenzae]AVI99221.1 periplasmic binding and sugar binding domain of LacI family protein [Haemophilus influenzae]AVJ01069.1 periplasmic binding and sugar binding domain of LacI family protein [Haemophilus influenzae]KIP34256.1 transcriptional regulator [Haemophilus influenzae]KIP40965.1 transcriptional regulator [Haemophilus influenzae]MBE4897289.1 substrate-binding domain-containing protein [Haemophilus influenzae]
MATMKDIARLAQVSTSTVSHVINGSRFVSDEIREKVMRIVAELNYTPSAVARSLKVRETKTIGLLVTATNNPFFAEVMAGVEQYCQQHQYNLIIATTGGDAKRLQQNLQTLMHKQVDGLLLMCGDSRFQADIELAISLPLVVMDWWFTELNADKILENSALGGYLATKALIDAGHRKIGIITGNLKKSVAQNRLQGYKNALSEAKIALNPHWVIESHFDFEGGVLGIQSLLTQSSRPTAVFCCSDTIAVGAYQAIQQQGLRIPQDLSIMGYDDIELARYLSPPLSTICQPKAELGKLAVEALLQRIKNPNENYRTLVLEPTCILRGSISTPSNI